MYRLLGEKWLCRNASHAPLGPVLQGTGVPLRFEIPQASHAQDFLQSHHRWYCIPNSFITIFSEFCYYTYSTTMQGWISCLSSAPRKPSQRQVRTICDMEDLSLLEEESSCLALQPCHLFLEQLSIIQPISHTGSRPFLVLREREESKVNQWKTITSKNRMGADYCELKSSPKNDCYNPT